MKKKEWVAGNANKFEPDYFLDGEAFEFTMASDDKKHSFIRGVKEGNLCVDSINESMMSYIKEAIFKKSHKKYSVNNISLCVLCIFDCTCWALDKYDSYTSIIDSYKLNTFFNDIKREYIRKKVFNNIYIIFPDCCATWWIVDINKKVRESLVLFDNKFNQEYPYFKFLI